MNNYASTCLGCILRFLPIAILSLSAPDAMQAQELTPAGSSAPLHLTLPAAVDLAIAHNRKLQLARLAVQDNEELKHIAESHFYPTVRNQSAMHHITELEGVVIPEGAFSHGSSSGSIPSQTLHIDQGGSTSYTSGTALDQPITQMFKIHAGVKAANAELESARIQAGDAQNSIAIAVHQLYYGYLIEQLTAETAEDDLKASTIAEDEKQKEMQEGRLLKDAELVSRVDLLEKRRSVLISKLNLDDLTLQLDDMLGLPLGTKLELDPQVQRDAPTLPLRSQAIEQVLQKSPSVRVARQNVEKAKAGLSAARDAYIPNVTGGARYSYQSGLPFLKHNFGTFGLSFTYDLFDGGAREANLKDARIKLSMAQTQLAQSENDARIQISAAYDKVEQLRQLQSVAAQALQAREESYRIKSQRAQVSAELASGLATAAAAVTSSKRNLLSAELNLYLAEDAIKRQLGEMPR